MDAKLNVWFVGVAYVLLGSYLGLVAFAPGEAVATHAAGWVALPGVPAVVIAMLVCRSRPVLGAGLLMAGATVIAAGGGLFVALIAGWSSNSWAQGAAWGVGAALAIASPGLLTGRGLIRGRRRLQCP